MGGTGGGRRRGRRGWVALALLWALPAAAQALKGYTPCLGCAEHKEIETRWHRPFLIELAGEGALMFGHFRLEGEAKRMGLCETDPLIRSPLAVNGCHAFSATRAWLIEAPLEVLAFTSPAWGLERRGHPRWAMALELAPIAYHAFAIRATIESIHRWQRLEYLLR
jgi:hypothetical protein